MGSKTPLQLLPSGYYSNLLASQYRNSPKFNKWLQAVLSIANDISNCLTNMNSAFDLDFAIGVQLDTLGLIVGVNRTVPFQPSNGISPILDDTTYRLLIKATIFNNSWNGTIGALYPIWENLFPGGRITIIDNQNMTADVVVTGNFNSIISDLISNGFIVPRPQTVAYTYLFGDLPLFGFGPNTQYIAGFGLGHWS